MQEKIVFHNMNKLLIAQSCIELVAGTLMFVKGSANVDKNVNEMSPEQKLYRRWHASGLLSLSFLGFWVVGHKLEGEARDVAAATLLFFHSAATAVYFYATFFESGKPAIPQYSAFLNPHLFLTAAFAYFIHKEH